VKKKQGSWTHGVEDILLGFGFLTEEETQGRGFDSRWVRGPFPWRRSPAGIPRPGREKKDQRILIFGVRSAFWMTNWVTPASSPASAAEPVTLTYQMPEGRVAISRVVVSMVVLAATAR
jgi:hypothetical protein